VSQDPASVCIYGHPILEPPAFTQHHHVHPWEVQLPVLENPEHAHSLVVVLLRPTQHGAVYGPHRGLVLGNFGIYQGLVSLKRFLLEAELIKFSETIPRGQALLDILDRRGQFSGARSRQAQEAGIEETGGVVREEGGDERRGEGGEGGLLQVRGEGVLPLEAERPEPPRGVRGGLEGAEGEARGGAAGGADVEGGRGRGREASHEGLHLGGGGHGEVGAVTEEDHGEVQRRRLRGAVALGLVVRMRRRRRGPVRWAEGAAILESAHGGRREAQIPRV
jgi:hypothetical protein